MARKLSCPPGSRSTTVPARPDPAVKDWPGCNAKLTSPSWTDRRCGAACSTAPQAAGRNQASRTVADDNPAPRSDNTPSGVTRASNGDGRGSRAAAAANSGASAEGAGVPAGRSRVNVPSSGTQTFSHTSQVADASMCNGLEPAVTATGSSTSPV